MMSVPPILLYSVLPGVWIIAIFLVVRKVLSRPHVTEVGGRTPDGVDSEEPVAEPRLPVAFIVAMVVAVLYSALGVSVVVAILGGEDPLAGFGLIITMPVLILAGLASMVDILVSARRAHTERYRRLQWIGLLLLMLPFPVWYGLTVLVTQLVA